MSKEAELSRDGVHDDSAAVSVADTTRALLPELRLASVDHLPVLASVAEASEVVVSATVADEVVDLAEVEAVVAAASEEAVEASAALDMVDQMERHPAHVDQVDLEEVAMIVAHPEAAAAEETMPTSSLCHQEGAEEMIAVVEEATVIETEISTVARNGHSRVGMMTRDKDGATNGSIEHGKTPPN